jgi:hypothetical protein
MEPRAPKDNPLKVKTTNTMTQPYKGSRSEFLGDVAVMLESR